MISRVSVRMLSIAGVSAVLLAGAAVSAPTRSAHSGGTGVGGTGRGGALLPPSAAPPAPVPLATGWRYLADPHNVGLAEDWGQGGASSRDWLPVNLPNDFNPIVSPSSDLGTVGWYALQFTGPSITRGRAWQLAFESVRRNAQVWLNGYKIGSNSDPYAPFKLPAPTLIPGRPNLLVVRVDNFRAPGSLPEDWWNWGGIMGPVSLEPSGRLALNDLGVTPELGCGYRCGDLLVQGTLLNSSTGALRPRFVVRVTSPRGQTVTLRRPEPAIRSGAKVPVRFRVSLRRPVSLWSPGDPSRYRVLVQTVADQRVEQDDTLQVGLRGAQVRNGILYLNGHRLWLHGAAIHEDLPDQGAALSDGDIDTIVSELRSVGANITRAHYLLSPRLLDALDAAGIMVWAQPPVDHADPALRSRAGRTRALAALRSTLIGDRNHPSVIVDSVANELTPTPDTTPGTLAYLQQAVTVARSLNPGVPVALDTYCYPGFPAQRIYSQLDVLGVSHYFGWYPGLPGHSIANFNGLQPFLVQAHARYPRQALAVSEFGAESLFDGAPSIKGTYVYQSNYLQRTFSVLGRLPFMNGSIYWTLREFAVQPGWTGGATLPPGSTPDGLHHKGLITYDGTPKPAFAVAKQLFGAVPRFAAR